MQIRAAGDSSSDVELAEEPRKINWWVPAGVLAAIAVSYLTPLMKTWISGGTPPAPTKFTTSSGLDSHPSFSPDGTELVYSSLREGKTMLYLQKIAPGGAEQSLNIAGSEPSWTPDGKSIAFAADGIFLMPSAGGKPRRVTSRGMSPAWANDSSRLAFVDGGKLFVVSTSGGDAALLIVGADITEPHFHPRAERIAYLSGGRLREIDLTSKQARALIDTGPPVECFAYANDGAFIYFVGGAAFHRLDLASLKTEMITRTKDATIRGLALNASGTRLAYTLVETPERGNIYLAGTPAR